MIHVGTARVDIDKLRDMSSLYQTTSPSYLFMASLEIARAYMEEEGKEKLEESVSLVEETINSLGKIERVHLFTGDEEDHTIYAKDNTKILFRLDGMTGTRAKNILRKDYNIRLEMADYYYGLILTSLMNEKEDFEKLVDAVVSMAKNSSYEEVVPVSIEMPTPKIISPIYEAFYGNKKVMDLKKSIGKISASYVIPYPPGIPLICPGEEITQELCEHIWFLMDKGIEIVGLIGYNKDKIEVVD
jgi:lysine decarboxylase